MIIVLTPNDLKDKTDQHSETVFLEEFKLPTEFIDKSDTIVYSNGHKSKILKNKNGSCDGGLEHLFFILLKGLSFYDATQLTQSINHNLAINAIL